MANYYVDLSQNSTGNTNPEDQLNPLGWLEFFNRAKHGGSGLSTDIYFLKGSVLYSGNLEFSVAAAFNAWESDKPWKIAVISNSSLNFYLPISSLKGGIISALWSIYLPEGILCEDMYINIAPGGFGYGLSLDRPGPQTFRRCSIILENGSYYGQWNNTSIQENCIIYCAKGMLGDIGTLRVINTLTDRPASDFTNRGGTFSSITGTIFSKDMSGIDWPDVATENEVSAYNVISGYGVGTLNSWGYTKGIYYVDQSYTNPGIGHLGTETDPYSWEDFYARVSNTGHPEDVYLIKGERTVHSGSVSLSRFGALDAWDINNPWKWIKSDSYYIQFGARPNAVYGEIRNGIIHSIGSINFNNKKIFTSWISTTARLIATDSEFYGCTIRGSSITIDAYGTFLKLIDTVLSSFVLFAIDSPIGFTTTFKNTVLGGTMSQAQGTDGIIIDEGGNQENWPGPVSWPASSDGRASYNFLRYANNISAQGSGSYDAYITGLFGTLRKNLGAFYFATPFYVDLNQNGTGLGTIDSPFNREQFNTRVNRNNPANYYDEYLVKGTYTGNENGLSFLSFYSIRKWGTEPWRVDINEGATPFFHLQNQSAEVQGLVEGGIIRSTYGIMIGRNKIVNCYLFSQNEHRFVFDEPTEIYGSTLRSNSYVSFKNQEVLFKDCVCVYYSAYRYNSAKVRFRTSACNLSKNNWLSFTDGTTFDGSNQFDLTALTNVDWPSVTDSKEKFKYQELVGNIIDIKGGPFDTYPTGLFGRPRYGIGAFFFDLIIQRPVPGYIEVGQNWNARFAGNTFVMPLNNLPEFNHPEYCDIGQTYFFDDFLILNASNYNASDFSSAYVARSWLKLKTSPSFASFRIAEGQVNMPQLPETSLGNYAHFEMKVKLQANGLVVFDISSLDSIMNIPLSDGTTSTYVQWAIVSEPTSVSGTPARLILKAVTDLGTAWETIIDNGKTIISRIGIRLHPTKVEFWYDGEVKAEVLYTDIIPDWGVLSSIAESTFKTYFNSNTVAGSAPGTTMELDYIYTVGLGLPSTCEGESNT